MTIALINCTPVILKRRGTELTLGFKSMAERLEFEEAVRVARLSPEECATEYAKKNGIDQGGVSAPE